MKLSIFSPFGLKTPIHARKLYFWGDFTPKIRNYINYINRYISPICPEAPHCRICTKFGTAIGAAEVIICTNFMVIRQGVWILWGLKFAVAH